MSLIANNIKSLRKKAGFTQESFAGAVGIKRSLIGAYEEARAEPRLQTLIKIAKVLNVSADALINKDLASGNIRSSHRSTKILSITVDENDDENIEMVPHKAAAGYLNGYADPEYLADLPKFKLPMLSKSGTYRAFEIQGDSMKPLPSGSIVIGKYLESLDEIKNGKTYVLLTHAEGVVYKRVFNYLAEKGALYLVSDNQFYSPYEVKGEDVEEVWEAKAYISIQFPDPESADELSLNQLTELLRDIKTDVAEIRKGLSAND